jgi:hypothetical protein
MMYYRFKYPYYRKQLLEMQPSYSGFIETMATGGKINPLTHVLFLAFPVIDGLFWFYFHLTSSISIPW